MSTPCSEEMEVDQSWLGLLGAAPHGPYLLLQLFPLLPHLLQGLSHCHTHDFSLAPFFLQSRKRVGDLSPKTQFPLSSLHTPREAHRERTVSQEKTSVSPAPRGSQATFWPHGLPFLCENCPSAQPTNPSRDRHTAEGRSSREHASQYSGQRLEDPDLKSCSTEINTEPDDSGPCEQSSRLEQFDYRNDNKQLLNFNRANVRFIKIIHSTGEKTEALRGHVICMRSDSE